MRCPIFPMRHIPINPNKPINPTLLFRRYGPMDLGRILPRSMWIYAEFCLDASGSRQNSA